MIAQFCTFIVGGVFTVAVDIFVTWLLLALGLDSYLSVSIGFFSGLIVNYIFHARLTFKIAISRKSLFRHFVVAMLNYLLTLLIVFVAKEVFNLPTLVGKIISVPIITLNSFALSRYWIFKK